MPDDSVRLRINSSDMLCHPSQRTSNYSNPAYPKLKVSPSGCVAIKYLENGHVTLPWTLKGKPNLGGTVFIYGTKQPSSVEKIADVLEWTADGKGGDGRGSLLSAQTYDDGRCHQINSCVNSAMRQKLYPNNIADQPTAPPQEQWCESDMQIPSNASGDLTLYWIWQWPTAPDADCTIPTGKDEYYTSCIDVEVIGGGAGDSNITNEVATNTLVQENFQTNAVSTYKTRVALTASPSFTLQNWIGANSTATVNPAFASSCSGVLASIAANAGQVPPSCPAGLYATDGVLPSRQTGVIIAPGVTEKHGAFAQPIATPMVPCPNETGARSRTATGHGASRRVSSQTPVQSSPQATQTVDSTIRQTKTVVVTVTATGRPQRSKSLVQYTGTTGFNTISVANQRRPKTYHRRHARFFG